MRIARLNLFLIIQSMLLTVMLMMVTLPASAADSVHWRSYSQDAFRAAKTSHRNVLLFGFSPYCHYCSMMNSQTMTNNSVIEKINKNYVPVKLNTVSEASIASRYRINVVPVILILNSDGAVLDSIYGYQEAGELLGKI